MKGKVSISVPGIQPSSARHSSGKRNQTKKPHKTNLSSSLKKKETSEVIERNIRNDNPKMRSKATAHVLIHWLIARISRGCWGQLLGRKHNHILKALSEHRTDDVGCILVVPALRIYKYNHLLSKCEGSGLSGSHLRFSNMIWYLKKLEILEFLP